MSVVVAPNAFAEATLAMTGATIVVGGCAFSCVVGCWGSGVGIVGPGIVSGRFGICGVVSSFGFRLR